MSGLRNFIIVFLLALLGFGILGHFIATSIVPSLINDGDDVAAESSADSSEESDDTSLDSLVSADTPVSGNVFNFAFFCLDINDRLAGVYLLHTNDGYETCVSVPIPGDAIVENNGAYIPLDKLYEDNSRDFILTKLYYLTGCKIDEYACLKAVDADGRGRNITELSTYLKYTYRIGEEFEYPNPDYIEGAEGNESSEDASSDTAGEFIVVQAGSYALNGKTDGVLNELMLLDTEYNPNAFDIYSELINRMINDGGIAGSKSKQAMIFNYIADRSFRNYDGSGASAYLFNSFRKASFAYSKTGGAWDEIREAIKTLEGKVQ